MSTSLENGPGRSCREEESKDGPFLAAEPESRVEHALPIVTSDIMGSKESGPSP